MSKQAPKKKTREELAQEKLEELKDFKIPKQALDIEKDGQFISYTLPDGSRYKRHESELKKK